MWKEKLVLNPINGLADEKLASSKLQDKCW